MSARVSLQFLPTYRTYVPATVSSTIVSVDSAIETAALCQIIDARPTANLVQEFNMLDLSNFTVVSGAVSQITNKKSGVSWAEATNRPTYNATGINGRPSMNPNGTSHTIQSTEAAVLAAITDAAPYTLYYVAKHSSVRLEYVFAGGAASGANTRAWGQSTSSGGRWRCRTSNSASTVIAAEGSAASNANANVFAWSNDATSTSVRVNGTVASGFPVTQTTASLVPTRANLFARPSATTVDFYNGLWGAQLLYNTLHDAATQIAVTRWLGALWGITVA